MFHESRILHANGTCGVGGDGGTSGGGDAGHERADSLLSGKT